MASVPSMIMLHLRIVCPSATVAAVGDMLADNGNVANIIVLPDASRHPRGDLVACDVPRDAANDVLDALSAMGIGEDGSIAASHVEMLGSSDVDAAEAEADEAVVWEEFSRQVDESSRLTWSFIAFLAIAILIAAIGIVVDSPILIVGAMVLGPEFGPIAGMCFGIVRWRLGRIAVALWTLLVGYTVAVALVAACAFLSRVIGWISPSLLDKPAPQTAFIVQPDRWSFVVALLAGVAGILSLTSEKSSTLVGVFISVTTVPAAAYVGLALAVGPVERMIPSAIQLGVNITGMTVSGTVTLLVLRGLWGSAELGRRNRRHRVAV